MIEKLEKTVLLACEPDKAFVLFTESAGLWWPETRRHTKDPKSEIRLLAEGRFFERAADGHEVELGKVLVWDRPHRLLLDFYVGTDADHPTEVEVLFIPEGNGTRVTVIHGPKPESEALYTQRVARFDQSWELVLAAWSQAVRTG